MRRVLQIDEVLLQISVLNFFVSVVILSINAEFQGCYIYLFFIL